LIESPIYGTETTQKYLFSFAPMETFHQVKIRCGAWLDGVQLTTDLKSSNWLGGKGGNLHSMKFKNVECKKICWMGTAGQFITSCCLRDERYM